MYRISSFCYRVTRIRKNKYLHIAEQLMWINHIPCDKKDYWYYEGLYTPCRNDNGGCHAPWKEFIQKTKHLMKSTEKER